MTDESARKPAGAGPAVLCPLDDHMGLDIARTLSARGTKVFGIDHDEHIPGRHSNACTFVHCPISEANESAYIDFLVEFGKSLPTRAVLYPLSDRHVLLFSEHREVLAPYFAFVMPPHQTMLELTTKDGLDAIAREYAIPAPQTHFISPESDIREIALNVLFPAILKPTESTYWHSHEITLLLRKGLLQGRAKVIVCQGPEELIDAFEQIARYDSRMIVQEVIPGEDERLVYAAFYVGRDGQVLGYFSGRKHRVIPTGFGSASFVETFADPALKDLVNRILDVVGYRGLGGLEFKQDPRDGRYKLIEFNTRFGMWDGLGVHCGVNLPLLSYQDALGHLTESQTEFRTGVHWVDWQRDLRAFLDYRRQGLLTFRQWRSSLKGENVYAIYSWADWRPGVAFTFDLIRKLGSRTRTAVTGNVSGQPERP